MSETNRPKEADDFGLGFLYKKCNIHKKTLNGLILVPEFRKMLLEKITQNVSINDAVVDDIIETLYQEWYPKRYSSDYKQSYIAENGIDEWRNVFMKTYRHIADGHHDVTKRKK